MRVQHQPYKIKEKCAERLKKLHRSTPIDDIKVGVEKLWFKVLGITNIHRRVN